jgi:acetyl esterase/lipase
VSTDAVTPENLFDDPEREARWRARFTAARVSLPQWARDAPARNVYVSNASGVFEVYAWDRDTDSRRRVTDRPEGTSHCEVSADGELIWWFDDTAGDEFGSWVAEPFAGGSGPAPAVPGAHPGYPAGLSMGRQVVALGASTDDGTTIWLARPGSTEPAEVLYANEHDAGVVALSRDESLVAIGHSEHGDSRHPALRVLSTAEHKVVAEKWDGEGKGLDALGFAPVAGDTRLLVVHERRGREELLVWDVAADTEQLLEIDLPGEISADWYPDGRALLVVHTYRARNTVHRLDLATGELSDLDVPAGTIGSAGVRPDGSVEYTWSSAEHPRVIRVRRPDGADEVLLTPPGDAPPSSSPVTDAFVTGPGGEVHALVARPDGAQGPVPTVFSVHGGPHAADEDRYSAYRAVWLDAGFAVVEVNYRGSTGYGSAWRDAIEGRPGLTELEDIAAVYDWAVAEGLADPARAVIDGASWGGYLCLLALGVQPQRWAAGVAVVPVADYVAAFEDEMEPLRDFDRALFGGSPQDKPELYRECSPITYVGEVRAPVLVMAGENDPRCPIRQIDNYLGQLTERGLQHEVYRFDAGHGSLVVAESLKQVATSVHFVQRMLAEVR